MRSLRIGASSSSAAISGQSERPMSMLPLRTPRASVRSTSPEELDVGVAALNARPSTGSVSKRVLHE